MSLIEQFLDFITGSKKKADDRVPKRVDEGLIYQMKQEALSKCKDVMKPYAECCSEHFISVMWACRPHLKAVNECLKEFTSSEVLQEYRERWLKNQN